MIIRAIRSLAMLYSWYLPKQILITYRHTGSSLRKLLYWFHHTPSFRAAGKLWPSDYAIVILLVGVLLAAVFSGVLFLVYWAHLGYSEYALYGLAFLIGYPIAVVYGFVAAVWLKRVAYFMSHPKKLGRTIVAVILEKQVRQLRKKHQFKVIAVVGSVGKTSTKLAIADLLGQEKRVRYQTGNYNDRVTVPLVFFDQTQPRLMNPFAWAKIIGDNAASIQHPYPFDIVVVELGTDAPGLLKEFAYLKPDIAIITAVTPEHMESFRTLDMVAEEELAIFKFAKRVLVNADDTPAVYLADHVFETYSILTNLADNYYAKPTAQYLEGQKLMLELPSGMVKTAIQYAGNHGAKIALAAAAVADMLGMSLEAIAEGLPRLEPFAGRMRILDGIRDSKIIDDSYNASPEPVMRGLDVLYATKTTQKIAILGSMNEMGDFSREAHESVGAYCSPDYLDLLITIGADARRWLAPAARAQGCVVHTFTNPYEAGTFARKQVKSGAVVLVEGSQNGVFAEEAIKQILAHPADAKKLVRQTKNWMKIKARQFRST